MFLKNFKFKNYKRLGRGESSGLGKTCGRGHKGQKSRSGSKLSFDFEGGQTKFFKKIPKFGFKSSKSIFSLNFFNLIFLPFSIFTKFFLKKINFINKKYSYLKIFSYFFNFNKKVIFYNFFITKNIFLFFNFNNFTFIL
ncbi:hypothetical protein NDNC_0990 [Candidatus Nasuia deltocephalinicola]|uniref:50S ribosomal protein L15 n=1 Tax=Candidatus Nasuia deltocephalincola TaxID=1160784 RepID=A0A974WLN1_9PROT|nr:50S ribosomal protein L15 [Candidatus Nasuia deltocephalinicola]BEH03933.1 hypothetical protein NDNC_0990 [Candidatus Nasuia deltocephalinicola]